MPEMDQPQSRHAPSFDLCPVNRAMGEALGPAIAAMPPWSTVDYPAANLTAFLINEAPALRRFAAMIGNKPAGVVCVRSPWLRGPYLQLLAVLPPYQTLGIGAALLQWFEEQATSGDRWHWLCCSTFNARALAFYEAHGYETITTLTGLLQDGVDEFLMRKRNVRSIK